MEKLEQKFMIVIVCVAVFTASVSFAAELNVPAEYATIREAVNAAVDGDVVIVADGVYTGNGNRDIYVFQKSLTIKSAGGAANCIINCEGVEGEQHRAFYFRHCTAAGLVLDGFTIINGYQQYGGAIFIYNSTPLIKNCVISGNYAYDGGGICCQQSTDTRIKNSVISQNSAVWAGGVRCWASTVTMTNCFIEGNTAEYGGAIDSVHSVPALRNCMVVGNMARDNGGAMRCEYSVAALINCTLSGNLSANGNALACNSYKTPSTVSIENSILWNGADEIDNDDSSVISIVYSDVFGGWVGEGNIDSNPLFAGEGYWDDSGTPSDWSDDLWVSGDYHLTAESVCCIDTGDPNFLVMEGETDIDGEDRVIGARVDMGADEYGVSEVHVEVDVKIKPSVLNTKSRGKWVVACLALPAGMEYTAEDVEAAVLDEEIGAVAVVLCEDDEWDFAIYFVRSSVIEYVVANDMLGEVELSLRVEVTGDVVLEGADEITVKEKVLRRDKGDKKRKK